jgi:hypothetical protein
MFSQVICKAGPIALFYINMLTYVAFLSLPDTNMLILVMIKSFEKRSLLAN